MKENIIAYMKTAINIELMGYKFYLYASLTIIFGKLTI